MLQSSRAKEAAMSQKTVEFLIGRLATDETARASFRSAPAKTLAELAGATRELTDIEREALSGIDPEALERFAEAIDPRLQRLRLPSPGAGGPS